MVVLLLLLLIQKGFHFVFHGFHSPLEGTQILL